MQERGRPAYRELTDRVIQITHANWSPIEGSRGKVEQDVTIIDVSTETFVIDKDSTGKLWATWTQGRRPYVAHTTVDDKTWTAWFIPPVSGTTLNSDELMRTLLSLAAESASPAACWLILFTEQGNGMLGATCSTCE